MSDGKSEAMEAMAAEPRDWPKDLTKTLTGLRDAIWQLEQFGRTKNTDRLMRARRHIGDGTASLSDLMSEYGL